MVSCRFFFFFFSFSSSSLYLNCEYDTKLHAAPFNFIFVLNNLAAAVAMGGLLWFCHRGFWNNNEKWRKPFSINFNVDLESSVWSVCYAHNFNRMCNRNIQFPIKKTKKKYWKREIKKTKTKTKCRTIRYSYDNNNNNNNRVCDMRYLITIFSD